MSSPATLVSGARSGIGAAIARRVLDAGGTVVDLDRKPPVISHDRLHYIEVDLSDPHATAYAARSAPCFDIASRAVQGISYRGDPAARAPADVMKSVVTGRMGTPDEVADAVAYFLSPQCAFVTGQLLYVCGRSSIAATSW